MNGITRDCRPLRVAVMCEASGRVRDALRARGVDAWSIDLLPCEGDPQWHIQGDARDHLNDGWGAMIAHPECTYLANSGSKHLYRGMKKENGRCPDRWAKMEEGAKFYRTLRDAPIKHKVIENPVMHGHAIKLTGRGETQFVHPHFFGDPFFKWTGFELINLPKLKRTHWMDVPEPGTDRHKEWSACHRAPPGPDRWRDRSRTYPGIANALADMIVGYLRPTDGPITNTER